MGRIFHLGGHRPGLNASTGDGRFSLGGRGGAAVVQDPYAAHVARLQAIDGSGGYYTGQDYTASLSQAGLFVDAFGGALTYASPNVMASPSRVVDATSGLVYASSDGADDTAVGSAAETVDTYTAVFRSPPGQAVWNTYGAVLDKYQSGGLGVRAGIFSFGGPNYSQYGLPRAVRRNGAVLDSPFDLDPVTAWQVVSVQASGQSLARVLQLACLENTYFLKLHLACLRKWPAAPSAAVVSATEQELASYYAGLIANGSN